MMQPMTLTTRHYNETNTHMSYLGRTPVIEVTAEMITGAGAGAGAGTGARMNVVVGAGGGAGGGAVETGVIGTAGIMVTTATTVLSQGVE